MLIVLPNLCLHPIFFTKVIAQDTKECAFISPHSTGSENFYPLHIQLIQFTPVTKRSVKFGHKNSLKTAKVLISEL